MNAAPRYRVASSLAPVPPPNPGALGRDYFAGHVPANEQYRPHFGRTLNLDTIDQCVRAANSGMMARITDLARETISLDGHVIGLLQKRLNRVSALEWEVQPASGPGIDEPRAKEYAAQVRENLLMVPNFGGRLRDLAWGIFDGRSSSEIEWYRSGKSWGVRDLHWIHPRRLSFGPDRDLRVIEPERQIGNFYDVGFELENVPWKFVTFRPRMFGDYQEREGLAYRTLYWSFFGRCGTRERLELMEIFGKPWRILIPKTGPGLPPLNLDSLTQGFQALTMLGFHNTARMPANVDVQVVQPEQGAGQVHGDVIRDAREVLSVMYTGHVIETNAAPTGLGSGVSDNARDAFELLIACDATSIAEAIEDKLTDAIVVTNHGPQWVSHAPAFRFNLNPPADGGTEADRIGKALGIGLRVAEEEARKRVGVREVRVDEAYLVRTQRPAELGQIAPPPGPELVFPVGKAPPAGELVETPGTAMNGLGDDDPAGVLPPGNPPPPALPPGTDPAAPPPGGPGNPSGGLSLGAGDDDLDADEDIAALCEKMTALGIARCEHGKVNRCRICGIERQRDVELGANGEPQWSVAWKPLGQKRRPSPPSMGDTPAASPVPGGDDLPSPRAARDEEEPEPSPGAVAVAGGACPECGAEPGTNIDCETCTAEGDDEPAPGPILT